LGRYGRLSSLQGGILGAQLADRLGLLQELTDESSATSGATIGVSVAWIIAAMASPAGCAVVAAVVTGAVSTVAAPAPAVVPGGRRTSQTTPCGRRVSSTRRVPARIRRRIVLADTPRMAAACSMVTGVVVTGLVVAVAAA
jgi:hypothetical protein